MRNFFKELTQEEYKVFLSGSFSRAAVMWKRRIGETITAAKKFRDEMLPWYKKNCIRPLDCD